MALSHDIGGQVSCRVGVFPTNSAAATTNGAAIDRMAQGSDAGFMSAAVLVSSGAPSGTPTSFTVNWNVQESADGSTGWTTIASATQVTTNNQSQQLDLNLSGAERFIRVQGIVAFVGGTSPLIPIQATAVLGGSIIRS